MRFLSIFFLSFFGLYNLAAQCEADHIVEASSFQYAPAELTIEVGESVAFFNMGGFHDVNGVVNSITEEPFNNPVSFSLPAVTGSDDGVCLGTITFDVPGTYNYDCSIGNHAADGMVASIIVNPPATNTIVDIIFDSPDHTLLENAILEADLAGTLNGAGPYTVFAPTDAAFEAFATALSISQEDLLALPNLTELLQYHVLGSVVMTVDLENDMELNTLVEEIILVNIVAIIILNQTATITNADIVADNGVVHVIDAFLTPMVIDATDEIEKAAWSLAPNPASGQVQLINVDFAPNGFLRDMSGRLIFEITANARTFSVSGLAPGVYFVELISDGKRSTQQLLVQ